jgi:hypothetical protein
MLRRRGRVRYRVDRLINEQTGVMRELTGTVALKVMKNSKSLNEECLCYGELGECPRGELMYWREIWLERVNPKARLAQGAARARWNNKALNEDRRPGRDRDR